MRSSGDLLADRRFAYAMAAKEAGDHDGAADLIRQALELVPTWAAGWFALGEAATALGRDNEATAAFERALGLAPDDPFGARARLARLGAAPAEAAISAAYVAALFDDYADRFDDHLTGALGYRAPEFLRQALIEAAAAKGRPARFATALDLGCGTGLMAAAIHDLCEAIDGVDLSAAMLRKAQARGFYRRLELADAEAALAARAGAGYDLIVAADVFVYVGALGGIFRTAAKALAPDGLLAFTTQSAGDDDSYSLGDDLRYGHGAGYVAHALAEAGFSVVVAADRAMRTDRGAPVPGRLHVAALTP